MNVRLLSLAASLLCLLSNLVDAGPELLPGEGPEALYALAIERFEQDDARAGARLLKQAADAGSVEAQSLLGALHLGEAIRFSNARRGFQYLEAAAEAGDFLAEFNLARAYRYGIKTKADDAEARKRFLSLAERPDPYANIRPEEFAFYRARLADVYFELGRCAMRGEGVEKNEAAAVEWWLKASDLEHAWASLYLADAYARGAGAEQDWERAGEFLADFQLLARGRFQLTYTRALDRILEKERRDSLEDEATDFAESMDALADSLRFSFGVALLDEEEPDFDPAQSYRWLERVTGARRYAAWQLMGEQRALGIGVELDLPRARELFERVGIRSAYAQYNLAAMLQRGLGGLADESRARMLFHEAAAAGVYAAAAALADGAPAPLLREADDIALSRDRAQSGDLLAGAYYGFRQLGGAGVDTSQKEGGERLRAAAQAGLPYANLLLGRACEAGTYPFPHNVRERYRQAAYLGVARGSALQARQVRKSLSAKAQIEAAGFYLESVRLGDSLAMAEFGVLAWRDPEKFGQSKAAALPLLREAAARGYAEPAYLLGVAFRDGEVVGRDSEQAIAWLERAAADGHDEAARECAALLIERGEAASTARALSLLRASVRRGHVRASVALGRVHRDGAGGQPNRHLALRYFAQAAGAGNFYATNEVALLLEQEGWSRHDPEEACRLFQWLGSASYRPAEVGLARCYERGVLVMKNAQSAYQLRFDLMRWRLQPYAGGSEPQIFLAGENRWFDDEQRQRAQALLADAAYELGRMFQNGGGIKRDRLRAARWFRRAIEDAAHPEARFQLGSMLLFESKRQKDREEGLRLLAASADSGYVEAQVALGRAWHEDSAGLVSESDALRWLKAAARSGNREAASILEELGEEYEREAQERVEPETPSESGDDADWVELAAR